MRNYIPTLGQLIDRLSICNLKSIKIKGNKKEYEEECKLIMKDLDEIAKEKKIPIKDFGQFIRAIQINQLINEMIWENESFVRKGENKLTKEEIADKLQFTHSLNRIRNQATNMVSNITGERKDLKLDYMEAKLTKQFGYNFEGVLNEKY